MILLSLDRAGRLIDYVFEGEADRSFVTFLRGLREGSLPEARVIAPEAAAETVIENPDNDQEGCSRAVDFDGASSPQIVRLGVDR